MKNTILILLLFAAGCNQIKPIRNPALPAKKIVLSMEQGIAILTPAQIAEIVKQSALSVTGQPDEILTLQQAAEHLKIKPDNLSQLSHDGRVPCRNLGLGGKANFRYSKNALSDWSAGKIDKL